MGLVSLAGATLMVSSPSIEDRWACLTELNRYVPQESVWIRVPQDRQAMLTDFVRSFANQEGLWFAMDVYPAGAAGIKHKRYMIQACSRSMDLNLRNTHEPELFAVHSLRGPGGSEKRTDEVFGRFVNGLEARFTVSEWP